VRRRDFIKAIAGAATLAPRAAPAQQSAPIARIGFFSASPQNPAVVRSYPVFLAELHRLGFTAGQNAVIEYRRNDEGESKAFAAAADLIDAKVDVIVAVGPELALKAARTASRTTPIVVVAVNYDPIAGGYVSNMARPDGNITGLFYRAPELAVKQVELLVEAIPDDKSLAVLWEPASAEQFEFARRAMQSLNVEWFSHKLENPPFNFDEAFEAIARDGTRRLLVLSGPAFADQSAKIAGLALRYRLPTMFTFPYYVEDGGLMSYGIDPAPMLKRAATYVARILRGAQPADLPVERPANFELTLNLKTARTIGVTFPTSILVRADEVIE
jgi:putative ABC transport system substrate-binding protein